MKNEMLALILAGWARNSSRKLTQSIAKPAVQFGGATVSLTLLFPTVQTLESIMLV